MQNPSVYISGRPARPCTHKSRLVSSGWSRLCTARHPRAYLFRRPARHLQRQAKGSRTSKLLVAFPVLLFVQSKTMNTSPLITANWALAWRWRWPRHSARRRSRRFPADAAGRKLQSCHAQSGYGEKDGGGAKDERASGVRPIVENGLIPGSGSGSPTFLAAAGNENIIEELKHGKQIRSLLLVDLIGAGAVVVALAYGIFFRRHIRKWSNLTISDQTRSRIFNRLCLFSTVHGGGEASQLQGNFSLSAAATRLDADKCRVSG